MLGEDRPRRGSPRKLLPDGPPAPLAKTEPVQSVWPARRASLSGKPLHPRGGVISCARAQRALPLAKSEAAEGTEDLRANVGSDGVDDVSVRGAIGVAKDDTGGDSTFDDKLPSVLGTMMRGAQRDERVRIVLTAFGARNDMVKIRNVACRQPGTMQRPLSRRRIWRRTAGGISWCARILSPTGSTQCSTLAS